MKGNIVFYLLMKYLSLLTSRLSHNMSLTEVLSFGGCVDMVVQEYILISMFEERHMHNLMRLNGCGASNERQYCFLSTDEIFLTFNEPFFPQYVFN